MGSFHSKYTEHPEGRVDWSLHSRRIRPHSTTVKSNFMHVSIYQIVRTGSAVDLIYICQDLWSQNPTSNTLASMGLIVHMRSKLKLGFQSNYIINVYMDRL